MIDELDLMNNLNIPLKIDGVGVGTIKIRGKNFRKSDEMRLSKSFILSMFFSNIYYPLNGYIHY